MVTVGGWDVPESLRKASLRRLGCAGAELCYLAAGRLAAVHLSSARLWDVAAAGLIAQEAGAQVSFVDSAGADSIWPWDIEQPKSRRTLVAWAPGVEDPRPGAAQRVPGGTPSG
jgi:fructose-1,6-bisphosphatase/inositol monophosphatase family enzyme